MMTRDLVERVDIMGSKMTIRSPFISAVFTTLPKRVVDYGTAATNGTEFVFGREFCDTLDEEELLFVGLHESCHVVLGHIWRSEGYDPDLSNTAQDAVINAMLISMGYKAPKKGVYIPWVTPEMDWEEVYRKLKQEQQGKPPPPKPGQGQPQPGQQGQGQGQGEGQGDKDPTGSNTAGSKRERSRGHDKYGGGGWDGKGDCDPCPTEAKRAEIEATILTAAKMARTCGDKSSLIDRVIGKVGAPTVPWLDECRAMMLSTAKDDYSFSRLSRRMLDSGLAIPSLYSENIGGLAVGFDMSGSIGQDDADRIAAELQGVVDDCNPDWVEVAFFDTKIGRIQRFEKGEPLELKPKGGGGTRFAPVFEHFAKVAQDEPVCGMIFFTDMESSDLMQLAEPTFPVLWGNIAGDDNVKVPFGRVVRVAV